MRNLTFNWEDARYFLAVARAGQMGKAAASLNISTITLSRHLSYLQQRTGTPLFTRLSRGLKLTDEGLRLMHYLERAEAEIEAASEIFRGPTNSVSGTVRIAAPEGFALRVLTPQLNALLEANPDLNLEIVPQSRGFSLSRREADIAVMVGKPTEPNLDSICLGSYSLGLYASRPYLDKFGVPKDIEGLANHRLIGYVEDLLFSDKLNTPRSVWSQWHSQAAIYSPIGQVEAVKAGLGVGVLHRFLIKETDDLIRLIPEIEVQREFYLVYHQSTEKVPRIGATLEFMKGLKVE
ncbi:MULTISPECIES: LysR family transcriptional regulator [unclassified Marinobacterium]|uniref:LysR family transcriptional regulator n=1 Tax=unclassified Marinobacterium TaxID=2644139 RepID=UPI00156A6C20|nr:MULTISPECIES: LysR family transcriptional regulator [unclassified Marinobacterium]NRP10152.1 HTH-type transcriptional regulator CynR [Marinobacterium sp. xm-g-48]NRP83251.1 HTH-type transcriptional regulator CynR [Marinobacterium sp. xm-d-509]